MKYCPYCGASLMDGATSLCPQCGERITSDGTKKAATGKRAEKKKLKRMKKDEQSKSRRKRQRKKSKKAPQEDLPEIMGEAVDDGYDGYYDDVLPPDTDRISEGLDKDLIKKVVFLGIAVTTIILMCVAMLCVL